MAEATINMGPGTHAIPLSLFRDNRNRVCTELKKNPLLDESSFVLLEGGKSIPFYDTDTDYVFRQVRFLCRPITSAKNDRNNIIILFSGIFFHVFLWGS